MSIENAASTPATTDWQAGLNALTAGRAHDAVAILKPLALAQPNSFEAHNFLGVALSQTGQHEDAIRALQTATRLNAQNAAAHYNLGLAYQGANRPDAARREFQTTLQLDARHTGAQVALAKLDVAPSAIASTPADANSPWSSAPAATQQYGAQQIEAMRRAAIPNILDILKGFAFGFIAAIICAVIWDKLTYYTNYQIGYVAVGIGFVIGMAVLAGASQKRGLILQIVSGSLALFGILLGETLLLSDQIRDAIASGQIPAGANFSAFQIFFISMTALPSSLTESPMSFLFLALGVYYAFAIPGKEKEAPEQTTETPLASGAPAAAIVPGATPSATPTDAPAKTAQPFDAPPRA